MFRSEREVPHNLVDADTYSKIPAVLEPEKLVYQQQPFYDVLYDVDILPLDMFIAERYKQGIAYILQHCCYV
jgi:hypothetical protein